jgi:amino acid adenylation domain-containing protein
MNISATTANLTTDEKRALLARLLAERAATAKVRPVSHAQSRLWFLDQLQPGDGVYNIPVPIPLNGNVAIDVLRRSVNEIIRRHEALRTTIRLVDGKPVQVIAPALQIDIPLVILGATEPADVQASRLAFQEGRRPFDLAKGPLIRATILKLGPASHILLVVMHHIVSDGWSVDVLLRELSALYAAFSLNQPSPLPELPIQYADYAQWQADWLTGAVLEEQLNYWRSALRGLKPILELPLDRPRPRVQAYRGATEPFEIGPALLAALNELGRREDVTLFMTLLAAFQTLLYRTTCETDFAIGSPIANRPRPEMADLIGFFVNTIVLRARLSPELTFRQLLQQVRQTTLDAYEHQDLPFEKLIEDLSPVRDTSHNPLFQVLLTVHHAGGPAVGGPAGGMISNGSAKFDLTAVIVQAGDRAHGFLEYNSDLFDRQTILNLLDRFVALLASIVEDADARIAELHIAPEPEAEAQVSETDSDGPIPRSVEAHAKHRPEAIALLCGASRMTWAEFDRAVKRHAANLASRGVRPGDRVAFACRPSADLAAERAAAIVGAQRLGAICVALDGGEPPRRLEQMLADAQARLVVTIDAAGAEAADGACSEPAYAAASDDDVACVVYRSGRQGHPSAVPLSHRMLSRSRLAGDIRIEPSDRVAWHGRFAADAGLTELFGALSAGATIVAFNPGLTPLQYARELRDRGITILFASARLLKRLSKEFPWSLRQARLIFTSGETLSSIEDLRSAIAPSLLPRVFALSGWTEAGGACAFLPLAELAAQAPALPLGYPFPGPRLDVLDDAGRSVAPGMVGEIAVGDRRTGDFVTRKADGYLEFRRRRDDSVVISGVRAEAAEVEAALMRHENIAAACVVAGRTEGEPALRAFVTSRDGNKPSAAELQHLLEDWLPTELIPASIRFVKELPLADDGAIDRLAVRAGLAARAGAADVGYVAPRNEMEQQVARLWAQTLGDDRIGIHDNFFSRGGHSLLATQLIARMSDHFGVSIPLRSLFDKPTIAEMSEDLAHMEPAQDVGTIRPVPRDRPIPLSFAQQRLWFLDRFEPGSPFYNMPNASRMRGPLDTGIFRDSINALIRRHESLRTTFALDAGGEPSQIVHPSLVLDVPVTDLSHQSPAARESEAQLLADREAQRPFDLTSGPLIRAQFLKLAADDHILLLTIHHIVADGWSMEVLFREFGAVYAALSVGQDPALPDLPIQYADFAGWQREWLAGPLLASQLDYWKHKLDGAPLVLELPTDRPRPRVQIFRGGMHTFSLPLSLVTRLRELCEAEHVTLFMALLAGFKAMLHRYTGQTDLVVGTPVANRVRPELEGLIGFFANTLVLRSSVAGEMSYRELLGEIRNTTSGAYANQDMPFEKLVEELAPERNLGYNPLFQVMFTLQNTGRAPLGAGGQEAAGPALGTGIAKFDLTVFLSETSSGIDAGFEYNSSLFDPETIARMGGHFATLLSAAAGDADRSVASLPMLSEREIFELETWNATAATLPDGTIDEMFGHQARQTPDTIAVTPAVGSAKAGLTYGELDALANGWAHRLRALGVGPDVCVGIHMSRSPAMITAVLGVLKAGGAYVPMDPKYPAERLAFMAKDARLSLILSERALASGIAAPGARVIMLDGDDTPAPRPDAPSLPASPDRLAYVMYTSGSTGRPKGVAMPHRPLVNLLRWQNARSALPPGAATLQFTSLSFDVSFQEIFSTLTSGGTLQLLGDQQCIDLQAMWEVIERGAVSRIFLPFVALQQLAEAATRRAHISSLREVITAGEQLKITPAIASFAEAAGFDLYNQYGPTETHVVSEFRLTGAPAQWSALPPIGKPIANASIHILDGKGQPVPVGVPGEIHVGGVALARGYLHNPDMTATRFVTGAVAAPDERLYRTGDRARYRTDGTIEFLGRADRQIKIRGFRVDPEEIESTLQRHSGVQAAAVIAAADGTGALRLIGYVQLHPGQNAGVQELRRHLMSWLPDHMIPAMIAFVETIPLTPSGKLDRAALPDPGGVRMAQSAAFAPPRTPVERTLASIWRELLQLERPGIHDNFFDLGGHSLLATRVMSRIREELDVDLPVRQLFESPTIEALAIAIVHGAVEQDEDLARMLSEIEAEG